MIIRKILISLLFALIVTFGATAASAQWKELGQRTVNFTSDHDTIKAVWKKGPMTALKLLVTKAPVHFSRIIVTFANKETQEIAFDDFMKPGDEGRAIDLVGNTRVVDKVDFWYVTESMGKKKSRVTLYGRS
ncbi:MAG: hypothetical protein ABJA02_03545 [Acidobacteriota bacterium]